MVPEKKIGRTVGILILLHLAVGLITPFVIIDRIRRPAGLFAAAAANAGQLRIAILLLFIGSAFGAAISIAAWPVLRRYGSAMGLWLFALAIASFTLQALDNAALFSTLSLSTEYAKAEAAQTGAVLISTVRKWTHYTYLLVAVSWIFLFFVTLYRFRLIPRLLTMLGIIASLLQIYGITLRTMFGHAQLTFLAMPLAPAYVAVAVWLIVKGFERHVSDAEASFGQASQEHA